MHDYYLFEIKMLDSLIWNSILVVCLLSVYIQKYKTKPKSKKS